MKNANTIAAQPLMLADRRRARGLSVKSVADATGIDIAYVRAIEDEQFDRLPGRSFNVQYICRYAAATGIHELDILGRYVEFLQTHPAAVLGEHRKTTLHGLWSVASWFRRWRTAFTSVGKQASTSQ